MNEMICGQLLKEIDTGKREFRVHSCFDHSINLVDRDNSMITILDQTKIMMPYSIMLSYLPKVSLEDSFIFYQGKILIHDRQEIDLRNFEIYDGSINGLNTRLNWEILDEHFKMLTDFLKECGSEEGILPLVMQYKLNKMSEIIQKDYLDWQEAYEMDVNFETLTQDMIGFGPGLTPSFDDLLCGLMVSDLYFYQVLGKDINEIIRKNRSLISNYREKTNLISFHMLKMAASGLCNAAVKELLISLYISKDDLKDILMRIRCFGHSSGTDILCGVYLSIKNKIERKGRYVSNN